MKNDIKSKVGAVWDAAGEQNSTENPWILNEARKRGLNTVFAFVDADPQVTWENPKRGVVERAGREGRMVDARLFAESYTVGAKNFDAFHQAHRGEADASFVVLTSRGGTKDQPVRSVDRVPDETLKLKTVRFRLQVLGRCSPWNRRSRSSAPGSSPSGIELFGCSA